MQEHSLIAQLVYFLLEEQLLYNDYVVDSVALSQTPPSNDNQIEEYGDNFTFFWRSK